MPTTKKIITKEYGIIGHPLGHSYSPTFFNEKFAEKGIKSQYLAFDIDSIEKFPAYHPQFRCGRLYSADCKLPL